MPGIFHKEVIQGTAEWARMRTGIPTASQMHRIVTPKLAPSQQAEMYKFELLAERITGEPTVQFTSHWMDRGSELERDAVAFFELTQDCDTEKIGFVTNAAGTIGASPDRLIGDSGLLEIKVGKPSTHVGLLLQSGKAYEEHKIQAQAQLWICEREFNYLLAYNPALPPALYRVERDDKFIAQLASAVTAFSEVLESQFALCVSRGWVTAKPQPQPDHSQRAMMDALKQSLVDVAKGRGVITEEFL